MGFYHRHILPTVLDKLMTGNAGLDVLRKEALATARGRVLEIGFGTGLNAAHYPHGAERVVGLDSNPGVERLARKRIDAASVPIEFHLGSGDRAPFADHSFETVVTTLALCSISDVDGALAEVRRLLAPGGRYLLLEHGLADDVRVQAWQRRLQPLYGAVLGGCRLDRPMPELVARAGFRFEHRKHFYLADAPRFAGFMTLGSATPI
jgi:ubiquinone/menaquinone biosynthesis C-methylase UbiE